MSDKLSIDKIGPVAIVRLTNPPRNFLGPVVRGALSRAFADLAADTQIAGVVLTGSDGLFSTGFNVAAPDMRAGVPDLRQLCQQIEDMPKPVVAALFGVASGAGLELALAAHARVALRATKVGMPDISVGLIPSGGGTQRLAHLLGADRALAVMLSGEVVPVTHPRVEGLTDEMVPTGVEKAAVTYLTRLIEKELPLRRTRDRQYGLSDPVAFQKALTDCRAALGPDAHLPEKRLVDCVERALLLPFEQAEEFEAVAFLECAASDYAQGLLHVQLAQRRAPNMPEAVKSQPQPVEQYGVIGGGAVGAGLVQAALLSGHRVIWFERSAQALEAARARLLSALASSDTDEETARACLAQLSLTEDLRDLAQADLLIEAVADNAQTKAQVFAAMDAVLPAAAVMLSHSGTLPVALIAQASGRTGQVMCFHMVPGAPLAELILNEQTNPSAVVTAAQALRKIGVLPIRAGGGGGGIGARMIAALRDAADFVLGLGAQPSDIDSVLSRYGLRAGVFAAMDSVGLEVIQRRAAQMDQRNTYALQHLNRIERLISEGRKGRAAGAGFLDWIDGKPVLGACSGAVPDETILQLCLGAMMNEGARLLREGIALRPSDVDLVMIRHFGFPAWRGGPLQAADSAGLFTLAQAMKPYEDVAPRLFAPDPGIAKLIRNGERLDTLNAVGRNRRRIDD